MVSLDDRLKEFGYVEGEPHVYFLRTLGPEPAIKIGWSSNVRKRIATIKGMLPYPIDLIGLFRGSQEEERIFHKGFNRFHIHGEWFVSCPSLLRAIIGLNQVHERKRKGTYTKACFFARCDPLFFDPSWL